MADLARCTTCGFVVPWDEIGRALMTEHLREHGRRPKGGEAKRLLDQERARG